MALRTVLALIGAGGLSDTYLASGAVTADKIASGAVTSAKVASGAIGTSALADDAVTAAKLADGAASATLIIVQAVGDTNIVDLAAGAPNTVDGYSLQANDIVLVMGQTDTSENGFYQVDTVGTGSNGEWSRPTTRDQQAEMPAGMLAISTGGSEYGGAVMMLVSIGTVGSDPILFNRFHEGYRATGSGEPEVVGTGDGSNLLFDLDVANPEMVVVFVDGLLQAPGIYSVAGEAGTGGVAQLQFSSGNAPGNGAVVEAIVFHVA
jgi:hypothetical protein